MQECSEQLLFNPVHASLESQLRAAIAISTRESDRECEIGPILFQERAGQIVCVGGTQSFIDTPCKTCCSTCLL